MRDEPDLSINTNTPPVRKIRKSLVIGVAAVILGFLILMSFAGLGGRQVAAKKEPDKPIVETNSVNSESFNKLPKSYAELREKESVQPSPVKEPPLRLMPEKASVHDDRRPPGDYGGVYRGQGANSQKEQEELAARRSELFFKSKGQRQVTSINRQENGYQERSQGANLSEGNPISQARLSAALGLNGQGNNDFLAAAAQKDDAIYLNQRVQDPISPYQVMAGTVIPAVLVSGINSDLPGPILAQVRENVFDSVTGKFLLIPQGTKLIGSYNNMVSWGQERVLIAWSRMIFPNGSSIVLEGMPAADLAGFAGLKDKVNNHLLKLAGAVLLSTFLNVGATYAAGDVDGYQPDVEQKIAGDVAGGINQAGQKIVERQLSVAPTIEIRSGWPFNVMVNRDIILRPYGKG